MALITLETLVLRGVSVLVGGKTWARSGFGYPAKGQAPVVRLTSNHPSPSCLVGMPEPGRQQTAANHRGADAATSRAGRPHSLAGSPASRLQQAARRLAASAADA